PASTVVLGGGVPERRTSERAAGGGRVLRVGAGRAGNFLGISGSVAVAGGKYFSHGDLPDAVCVLPETDVAVVRRGESRILCGIVCGDLVRGAEPGGDSSGGNYVVVAFLFVVGCVRADSGAVAFPAECAGECTRRSDGRDGAGVAGRSAGSDVELHGLGQRFDDRAGSGAAAADVPEGDDRSRSAGGNDVRAAIRGGVPDGNSCFGFRR